jgi:mannose-6-phosphate isomerase-like protein (cupin superfamily)
MIRLRSELEEVVRDSIRGGQGTAQVVEVLASGEMAGVEAMSVLLLEPGAWIGEHVHPDTEELYLVLDGEGVGALDGLTFPVGRGDAFLVRAGHRHGLRSGPKRPLRFVALLTRPAP